MPIGILFWVIYVIAILFGLWASYESPQPNQPPWFRRTGPYLVLWLLVGFLGWATFGPVIK